ncbi:MAG TPA: DHA2 family efflux MFS transporter permease subunit, partial [Bacteroidota bacterium]|nr:DHA2 family efflux MFS transporter permease subunit [Bacteroidota bacterium]
VADHFGYKRTYMLSLLLFTIGSFLCGIAWDENALIVFRIVQGAGAGFMMPVGMAIVTREFPPHRRGIALGFWSIAAAASVSLGPLAGGYLIDHFSWHMIFDVNVPVGLLGVFATYVIQREYKTEHIRSFDFGGFISMTLFLTSLLLALSNGNSAWNTGGWSSPFITGCFIIAGISFTAFFIIESLVEHPIIDLSLLRNFNFGMTNIVLFIFGLGMFGSTFLLPLYLQNSLGYTAFQAGLVFLPTGILQGLLSPVAGVLADRGHAKLPAVIGIVLLALSLYLNYFLSIFSEQMQIMIPLYIRGVAMGLVFTPLSSLALSEIPRHKMAQASGLFNVIRQVGGSFGVALLGAMLTRRMIFHMAAYGQAADQFSAPFRSAVARAQMFAQHAAGGSTAFSAARARALVFANLSDQAFVAAIADDFLIAAAITALCLIPILFLRVHRRQKRDAAPALE